MIAALYDTTPEVLRELNDLEGDTVPASTALYVPGRFSYVPSGLVGPGRLESVESGWVLSVISNGTS